MNLCSTDNLRESTRLERDDTPDEARPHPAAIFFKTIFKFHSDRTYGNAQC
jgi:hypothetical protein